MSIKSLFTYLISAVIVLRIGSAHADTDIPPASPKEVLAHLRLLYPNTEFTSVTPSPLNGIYEVVMGRNVAYVDQVGKHFLFGHLWDMAKQLDITAQRKSEIERVAVESLPLDQAVKRVLGKGERQLIVFSDPDCPFCQSLEPELLKLENVTIYTFLLPLEQLHPEARDKADQVWCAKDRAHAWENLMLRGVRALSEKCDTPIDSNLKLAERFRITGTPTLISGDGRIKPGMMSASSLSQWLSKGAQQ